MQIMNGISLTTRERFLKMSSRMILRIVFILKNL